MSAAGMKRALWIALTGLLLVLVLAAAAVGVLLYHPSGPQWLLTLIRSTTPLVIEAQALEGRMAGPLAVQGLRVEDAALSLRVQTLKLDWRPSALITLTSL